MSENINEILIERDRSHGPFSNQASCTQDLKEVFYRYYRNNTNTESLNPGDDKIIAEAIDMILHKIARIASGNPLVKDHWIDIAGYASLPPKFIPEM